MEQTAGCLAGHPWVAATQAVAAAGISGLLIVPTGPGLQAYRCVGRAGVTAVWEAHLGAPLPGLWRLVDALATVPGDTSETTAAALLGEPLPNLPVEEAHSMDACGTVEYVLRVPLELAIFRSHFPVAPIVPGVEQLRWVTAFARRHFALPARFSGLEMLRFRQVMQPGLALQLTLRFVAGADALHFVFRSWGGTEALRISDGRILFRDSDPALRNFP